MSRYFDFLCDLVDKHNMYSELLVVLHRVEFFSLIPNDDNREEDGKQLRKTFIDEEGQHALSQSDYGPCTVLEMLIALAFRLEFETAQSRWEKTTCEWFWILIDNLGLIECGNRTDEIKIKVGIFLNRHYNSDGNGGLFPLKNPKKDQRRVEIWYQMSAYIIENYPM